MKVAIVGSWNQTVLLSPYIPAGATEIISNGVRGIDACARKYAAKNGLPYRKLLPDYTRYGKNAPLYRNEEMIRDGELMLIFWDGRSRGTKYVIDKCLRVGKEAHIYIMPRKKD